MAVMIIFELSCSRGHRFEGWFASGEDFAQQSNAQMVRCPVCEDATVAIIPSAKVHVGKAGAALPQPPASSSSPSSLPSATSSEPGAMLTEAAMHLPTELLEKLREAIRQTENVGRRFPEEARKIHYEEVPPRAIRGQASSEEAAELREEGIDFTSLPAFLTGEQH